MYLTWLFILVILIGVIGVAIRSSSDVDNEDSPNSTMLWRSLKIFGIIIGVGVLLGLVSFFLRPG